MLAVARSSPTPSGQSTATAATPTPLTRASSTSVPLVEVQDDFGGGKRRAGRCCGGWCNRRRALLVTLLVVVLAVGAVLLVLFLVPPVVLQRAIDSQSMPNKFYISDIAERSFQLHICYSTPATSPVAMTVRPWLMTYSLGEADGGMDFGTYGMPGFEIVPGQGTPINHTHYFDITRPDVVEAVGHSALLAITTRRPGQHTLNTRGDVTFEMFGGFLAWTVPYSSSTVYTFGDGGGPAMQQMPDESADVNQEQSSATTSTSIDTTAKPPSSKSSPFRLLAYRYKFPLGVQLQVGFANTAPVSIDLGGELRTDLLTEDGALLTASLPRLDIAHGANNITLKFRAANLASAINYVTRGLDLWIGSGNKTSTVRLQNVRVESNKPGGRRIGWLNGWFRDAYLDVPITRRSFTLL